MKETRIFASPFRMHEQTKEEKLQWAEDNGMVWSVDWFITTINCDMMIDMKKYEFDSYEADLNAHIVLVNIVELASELSHQRLVDSASDQETILNSDGTYTDDAQKLFDRDYDYYYELIQQCK